MSDTLTASSKGKARNSTLVWFYLIVWLAHVSLVILAISRTSQVLEGNRTMVFVWCGFVIAAIPLALLAMRRDQVIRITEQGIVIEGTGIPFLQSRKIERLETLELNLLSCCWGAFDLLVLQWGKFPWQSVYLAPLASTEAKKKIGEAVAEFIQTNGFPFSSNLREKVR